MKVGGVMIDSQSHTKGYLVAYHLGFQEAIEGATKPWEKDPYFASHPTFDSAVDEVVDWLAYPGTLKIGISRYDGYLGEVKDASAQIAIALGWRALVNRKWYQPLLASIVLTGTLKVADCSEGVSDILIGEVACIEKKTDTYDMNRNANGACFRLFVMPASQEPDPALVHVRVLRARSIEELEQRLTEFWSRAAFARLQRADMIAEFIFGGWWAGVLGMVVIVLSWYWLQDYWYAFIVLFLSCGFVGSLVMLLAAETKRMDADELQRNYHDAHDFESLLILESDQYVLEDYNGSKEAWAAMLERAGQLVRLAPAKWFCLWALKRFQTGQSAPPRPRSGIPFMPWASVSSWLWVSFLIAMLVFVSFCPFSNRLAEAVAGQSSVRDVKVQYRAADGSVVLPKRDADSVLLVGGIGELLARADAAPRAGRRLRISCASPSGAESMDNILPSGRQGEACVLVPLSGCVDKPGPTVNCELPMSGEVSVTYNLPASSRSRVKVIVELITSRNLPLASFTEQLRWDPKLGNYDASSVIHEGGKQ